MTTYTLEKDFDITHSTADRVGRAYECKAMLIRNANQTIVGRYRGEGSTAAKAEAAACKKAKEAYYALPQRISEGE